MTDHPAFAPNRVAVVTGAASGIGLAAAANSPRSACMSCLADANGEALEAAAARPRETAERPARSATFAVDVSQLDDVQRLKAAVLDAFGEVAVLMNNAGTGGGGGLFADLARWRRILEVNLWGVINGVQAFAPAMIAPGTPGGDRQYRLQAGHHLSARRHRLQRQQGRGEGRDRGARPRCAIPPAATSPRTCWSRASPSPA